MRYSVEEIESLAFWEIEAAIRTYLKTVQFMVGMFLGSKEEKPKSKSIQTQEDAMKAIQMVGKLK